MAENGREGFSLTETTDGSDIPQSDTLVDTKLDQESASLVADVKLRPGVAPIKTQ